MTKIRNSTLPPGWWLYAHPSQLDEKLQSGQISGLDRKHRRIRLSNGKWYIAPSVVDMRSLSIGDRVEITYELVRHHYRASSVKPVGADLRPCAASANRRDESHVRQ